MTVIPKYTSVPREDPGELGPNEFTAGSVLSLTCIGQGASGGLTYSWSVAGNPVPPPNCTDCTIETTSITSTLKVGFLLYSFLAGVYTCSVSESGRLSSGNSEDITVVVVGEELHVHVHSQKLAVTISPSPAKSKL